MNIDTDIIVALLALLAGILSGVVSSSLTNRAQRRKNDADAAESLSQAAANLIEPLNQRIDALEAEVSDLRNKLVELLGGIKKLIEQIRALGHDPVWVPQELTAPVQEKRKDGRSKHDS